MDIVDGEMNLPSLDILTIHLPNLLLAYLYNVNTCTCTYTHTHVSYM